MLRNIEQINKDLAWLGEIENRVKTVKAEPCDVKILPNTMQKTPEFEKRLWGRQRYTK